jgi:hypothetical protein
MDKTEQYISQCKALPEEIKKLWKKELGDFVYVPEYDMIHTVFDGADNEYSASTNHISQHYRHIDKCTWLPRQDQLQDMVKNVGIVSFSNNLFDLDFEFSNFIMEFRSSYLSKFKTMEQLWLAFVMNEKFNKKWNGHEWIKQ